MEAPSLGKPRRSHVKHRGTKQADLAPYTPEEKEQAVRMVRSLRAELSTSQGTVKRVAEQLGYGVESVRSWCKQAEIDGGELPGTTTAEQVRIKALEQENRELKRGNGELRREES